MARAAKAANPDQKVEAKATGVAGVVVAAAAAAPRVPSVANARTVRKASKVRALRAMHLQTLKQSMHNPLAAMSPNALKACANPEKTVLPGVANAVSAGAGAEMATVRHATMKPMEPGKVNATKAVHPGRRNPLKPPKARRRRSTHWPPHPPQPLMAQSIPG